MSSIMIHNNTNMKIHVAWSWKGIIQFYFNDLEPGGKRFFGDFLTGWSDFTAVVATEENRFNFYNNASNIVGLSLAVGGLALSALGLVLLIPSAGTSSALIVAGTTVASTTIVAGTTVAITSGVVSLAGVTVEAIEGLLTPATFKGIFVSDKYDIYVKGAEIRGTYDQTKKTFKSTSIAPLKIEWVNHTSGKNG